MTTPIVDFVRAYRERKGVRFHMPGHKGVSSLGFEPWDITEVAGADVLYDPTGIIAESEENASALFGSEHTFYSAEGSTLCIKAMLAIATRGKGDRPWILAGRNAHRALIAAAALLDLRIRWLGVPHGCESICRADVRVDEIRRVLGEMDEPPAAVYLTSPDYLGNLTELFSVAEVCREAGIPLLVDNAHGAYLKFLEPSLHPLDAGAAMCCDSAHKTLPVLTGGAYLHVGRGFTEYAEGTREMLSLFASTSPSYLILQSLDACNRYLNERYRDRLRTCVEKMEEMRRLLRENGIPVMDSEPLKLVIAPRSIGYTGEELAELLRRDGMEAEYADGEYLVLMMTPENGEEDGQRLLKTLRSAEKKSPLEWKPTKADWSLPLTAEGIRTAMLSCREWVAVENAEGRIAATLTGSCPPAIPIAVSGDRITRDHIDLLRRYGVERISVCREE
jgi:arginine/lysine/ornithine decarboxylase